MQDFVHELQEFVCFVTEILKAVILAKYENSKNTVYCKAEYSISLIHFLTTYLITNKCAKHQRSQKL